MGVGRFHISVPVIAITVSAAIHVGLLTAARFMPFRSQDVTPPVIQMPQGEHAIQVTIVSAATSEQEQNDLPSADKHDSEDHSTAAVSTFATRVPPQQPASQPVTPQTQITEPQAPIVEADVAQTEVEPDQPPSPLPPIDIPLPNPAAAKPDPSPVATPPPPIPAIPTKPVQPPAAGIPREQSTKPLVATPTPTVPKAHAARSKTPPSSAKKQSANQKPGVKRGAEALNLPRPIYPSVSRRRGEQGLVVLQVEVLANGTAGRIKIVSNAGFPRLARAAVNAVRKARFRPATRNGQPVKDTVRVPFRFVLR